MNIIKDFRLLRIIKYKKKDLKNSNNNSRKKFQINLIRSRKRALIQIRKSSDNIRKGLSNLYYAIANELPFESRPNLI
jgi:hypothetical protein